LAFAASSDPFVAAATLTGLAALASSFVLFGAIVFMRMRLLVRVSRQRKLELRWHPLLAQSVLQVPTNIPPIAGHDAENFMVLWCRAQESVRGDARERLARLGEQVGLEAHALRLFTARSPRRRLLATITLGHLRNRQRTRDMEARMSQAPAAIAITSAHALLRIDSAAMLPQVLACAARREDWPLATVASILAEVDPSVVAPRLAASILSELRHSGGGRPLSRLLRLHTVAHAETLRPVIVAVLESCKESDALAAALAAVIHPDDLHHARRLAQHEDWVVRVAAVRALGRIGERADFALLAASLGDASWWVRHRAAQALCHLPGVVPAELEALIAATADRFAGDALRQALAEQAP
jgi:HEAT repeat protein